MSAHQVLLVHPVFRLVLLVLVLVSLVLIPAGAGVAGSLPPVDATIEPAPRLGQDLPGAVAGPLPPVDSVVEPSHPLGQDLPGAEPFPLGPQSAGTPDAATAAYKWYSVAGAGFIPSSSAITWSYSGDGCIQPTATGYWRASVNLVDGSVAKTFMIGYWNFATATATTGWLYKHNGLTGASTAIATVTTQPGSSGQGFRNIAIPLNEPIDNTWNSYMFVWSGVTPATAQQLCSMRVGYTPPPLWANFMPTLTK